MKSVKGLFFATSLAFLLSCESDGPVDPSLDVEGPVSAKSPQTLDTPGISSLAGISEARIDLTWADVANETGYEVHRAANPESGEYVLLVTTDAKVWSYSDTQATLPTMYCYKVRALRALGSRTIYSEFSSSICTLTTPSAPSNVSATASSGTIAVAWQDNSNVEAGFQIFISPSESGEFGLRATTTANVTGWPDNVGAGVMYCYRVKAYRVYTNDSRTSTSYTYSPESNTACATTPPPSQAPTAVYQVFAAPFSSTGVAVTSARIATETQPTSPGYQVRLEHSLDGGTAWSVLSMYAYYEQWDTPLTPDAKVCYRIIASNEAGDGQPSNVVCTNPPRAPTDLTMTSIDPQSVELTWRDNSAVEDGYQVWITIGRGNCSCGAGACDAGWDEQSYAVAHLAANTTRYVAPPLYGDVCSPTTTSYYIVATRDGGTSDWSNAVTWQPTSSP